MKLVDTFKEFLTDTVNLNQSRIDVLDGNVDAIQKFIRESDWQPTVRRFVEQGSWAHDTIIKPVDLGEFDADLLVMVNPAKDWQAQDYVNELANVFKASGVYKDKVEVWEYCVTVTYANEQKVDIAPCVVGRVNQGDMEVCNRKANAFEPTEPIQYTSWLIECNSWSGSNSFRKVTRLLKYLREIKTRFTCSSVLLTTLLGNTISEDDVGQADFVDVPTTLQTMMGRLDDFLQDNKAKPVVSNPYLPDEDFAASLTAKQYRNFRKSMHRYRGWVDDAIAMEGKDASIAAWQRLFGDQFAKDSKAVAKAVIDEQTALSYKGVLLSSGAHLSTMVDRVVKFGVSSLPKIFTRPPYLREPEFEVDFDNQLAVRIEASTHKDKSSPGTKATSGQALFPGGYIRFEAVEASGQPISSSAFRVEWRVTNTGVLAFQRDQQRGGFYQSSSGNYRWEDLSFRGVHFVEAFVVRRSDDMQVGQSEPFYVVIT